MRFLSTITFSLALWMGCTQAPQAPAAETSEAQSPAPQASAAKSYQVQPDKTKLVAIGTKVTGKHDIAFPIKEGILRVGENGCLTGGKIVVDIANLQVLDLQGEDKAKLEKHLRSEDFFAADKYVEGTLEITGCEKGASDTLYISANLTLRGITKNIRFPAVLHLEEGMLHSEANFNINRQEWGISYKGKADNLIRDEVNLSVNLMAQSL